MPAYTSDTRERRTEWLWINPQAQVALSAQRPLQVAKPANDNLNGDMFGEAETRTDAELAMTKGAMISHALRTDLTEALIIEEIRTIRQAGRKVRIQDVASVVGMTREHLGRRYKHCFR